MIRGERIVLREFDFLEARKADALSASLIEELAVRYRTDPEAHLDIGWFASVFERANDQWVALLALATRRPATWIYTLSDAEGQLLTQAFWAVNSYFFSRKFMRAIKAHFRQPPKREREPLHLH